MNMKKIAILALSLCMIAAIAVTGTIAYFTDTDNQTNTFTVGNVKIDLFEDFGDNDAEGVEELIPATGSAQAGTLKNGIEKEIYVENTGSEDAFVRVHMAIPTLLDDGDPNFDASANVLHWNMAKESFVAGKWSWLPEYTEDAGYKADSWNSYVTTIDGIEYNVYVATYRTAISTGTITPDAIQQVYLDSDTTNEDVARIKAVLGDEWKILVVAEAAQAAGFENAYEALNTAFGVPGAYSVDWAGAAKEKTWNERNSVKGN